jgi:hypothetical protein
MRPQVAAMAGKRPLPRKPGDMLGARLPEAGKPRPVNGGWVPDSMGSLCRRDRFAAMTAGERFW